MAVNLSKGKALPIGIDIGTSRLKMLQLRALPKGAYSVIAMAFTDIPGEARREPSVRMHFLHESIRTMIRSAPFKGNQCILSLPAEMTFVQHLKVAKMPADQLSASLHWELQGKLPYDPARAVIRHLVAGDIYADNEAKQEIIVMAANRDTVESHIDLLRRAKMDCTGVNIEPCAIVDCFSRMFRRTTDAARATLFVDIGAGSTQVVVAHGPDVVFARNLFLAGNQFDQAVADNLKVPLDEAHRLRCQVSGGYLKDEEQINKLGQAQNAAVDLLGEHLTSCLRYYESVFPNRPVERAVFLGGQAYDKRLCQALARHLTLPAQIGDPLAGIGQEEGAAESVSPNEEGLPDWAVAVGLSIGSAVGAKEVQPSEEVVQA